MKTLSASLQVVMQEPGRLGVTWVTLGVLALLAGCLPTGDAIPDAGESGDADGVAGDPAPPPGDDGSLGDGVGLYSGCGCDCSTGLA